MGKKTETWHGGWTRRRFLTRIGQVGGASALYETMVAMGLVNLPTAWAGPPKRGDGHGVAKSVLILGAGIGGLTTAYILSRYGYRCRILEATARAGGRNHTARRGSVILEDSKAHGRTSQQCHFDSDLYMNLGPGRLPYHHRRVLGYCQELGVELEPYIMNTTGNLFQTSAAFAEQPVVYRRIQNDTRGYIAELLAKAVNQGALNAALDEADRDRLLSLLQSFGPLGARTKKCDSEPDYRYQGSTRTGCGLDPDGHPTPDVDYNCQIQEKTPLDVLLQSEFWQDSFYDPVELEWQPTLFQPVGGMDMIVEGFLRQVGDLITYEAPVVGIETRDDGVSVRYKQGSDTATASADYCVSNIPCPVLERITDNNFSRDFLQAIHRTEFAASCKVGWQCNTRFWESNRYEIYGGISWTDDIIEQIWYPSNGYFGQKGTLTGAYIHDGACPGDPMHATDFGNFSLKERLHVAKKGGAKLHPEFRDDSIVPTDLGLSIAWQHVPFQEGAWPNWGNHQYDDEDYRRILLPDRRFYIVGDQGSTLPGWQEGAMMSAEHVVELIAGTKRAEDVRDDLRAPNTFKVTQGHG